MDFAMKNLYMIRTLSRSVVHSLFAHLNYFMFSALFFIQGSYALGFLPRLSFH